MTSTQIRQAFFDFFVSKGHKIVPSAPIVNKNDPSLLFTNAGMNQFKDYFLGHQRPENTRVADTQKCLRVSGKHNDLEEVGIDSYHHTMFEMLGNWSFGDYFKKEAIQWAWELLTEVYILPKDRLYVSVFEGSKDDGLSPDSEAADIWAEILDRERILYFDKKDNFWEMGETGPCGPCSEIHVDLRPDADRKREDGKALVNMDHPLVIEIWNLVFIQYNRKADSSLEELPAKHIDTGMGFERLCMAIQGVTSNYDTDVFTPFVQLLEQKTGVKYTGDYDLSAKSDIAFRVIVDHIRAVCFTIADGQLPSNTGAGYVIRRILRRAVRYYYSFLDRKDPLLHELVGLLAQNFADVFPELKAQEDFVTKIVLEEEKSFLRTLAGGLRRLSQIEIEDNVLDGKTAFELYDTYGFPIDLTMLIGSEKGWSVDEKAFSEALEEQKNRSRSDAKKTAGDWMEVNTVDKVNFVGYDDHEVADAHITKYRTINHKGKNIYQLVLDTTPFYAESGGQVGDTGVLHISDELIKVIDTQKENDLIIHIVDQLPTNFNKSVTAKVNSDKRELTENNHSATHLLHAALREVLGDHVQQRGSLVNERQLRFDFSHFEKMTTDQIQEVENIVNARIRQNIALQEDRSIPIADAKERGAMMLFGEKYGEEVRVITFDSDYSVELCGGCHVDATGQIGLFKIKSESAIAAGVRRVEAVTAGAAVAYTDGLIGELGEIKSLFKSPTETKKQISDLISSHKQLEKELADIKSQQAAGLKDDLIKEAKDINGMKVIAKKLSGVDMNNAKNLAHSIEQTVGDAAVLFAIDGGEKVNLLLLISKDRVSETLNAGTIIRTISKHIKGGGGGQPFYASAGGKDAGGIDAAIEEFWGIVNG